MMNPFDRESLQLSMAEAVFTPEMVEAAEDYIEGNWPYEFESIPVQFVLEAFVVISNAAKRSSNASA